MPVKIALPFALCLAIVAFLSAPRVAAQADGGIVPVKSEIQLVGGYSTGNVHYFGYSDNRHILPMGVEYDRNSFGRLIGSQVAYVAEVLPLVLLNEPAQYNVSGHATAPGRQLVYGAGISPVGARLMWRKPGTLQPYLIGKGGVLYFKNRVLSTEGTHVQWSAEYGLGVEKVLTNRFGCRIAYNDFHFSNGNIGRHNPGIDLMEIQAALTIRLGSR